LPVYLLDPTDDGFPDPERADPSGLLAVGADLRPSRLLTAYSLGIFPWYSEGQPVLWHCPDPRFVLEPGRLHLSRSLQKTLRRGTFEVRFDTAFAEVIDACASVYRPGQRGTWITSEMREAYVELHRLGHAHSVESWLEGTLVGGMYGVSLGRAFFGESMFAHVSDASKVALATLVGRLRTWEFSLLDCQQQTEHMARFGAEPWPRQKFLKVLAGAVLAPGRIGRWSAGG
jgi:leucyl/phenylalanyl-tRNA---protein transferase